MITLPPWSFTHFETFDNCPRQYYHRYILKEREPETEALRHGNIVHKALEDKIKLNKPLPAEYNKWSGLTQTIERKRDEGSIVYCELPLALTKAFIPTEFFARDVWGRGKADLVVIKDNSGWIGDWKTGKVKEKILQVKIFAAFLFRMFPQLQKITANNIWLVNSKPGETYRFTRETEKDIWLDVLKRINTMEYAASKDLWPEKPSGLCGWCHVKSCKYNTNKGA